MDKSNRTIPKYIQQHQKRRQSESSVVRTGCIPCLHDRVKCDGSNPRCRQRAISEDWRVNSEIGWQGHGTWRERRGIHLFVRFALAPERAGLFESTFWHRTVTQACFHSEAVFHVASAIGSLHEHAMKRTREESPSDDDGLSFALRQCNRSISLLTASSNDPNANYADPRVALITCVLFAVFEALVGNPEQAILHALQGRKLLQNCQRLAALGEARRLVDTTSILPVIGGLEIQAKSIQGKLMARSDTSGDPPLPEVSRIHSLQHGNWTLHYTWVKLLLFCQDTSLEASAYDHSLRMAEKRLLFSAWLKEWEESFADFLFREASALSKDDMQRARILKANHIAATMLANASLGRPASWEPYNEDCKAIIDLSASVLNTHSVSAGPVSTTFQFPFVSFGLWVMQPLFLVMGRCSDHELRRQAAGLVNGQARPSLVHGATSGREHKQKSNKQSSRLDKNDTETWNLDQWIHFTDDVRLDTAMAIYFGHLPSSYIDRPYYPKTLPVRTRDKAGVS